MRSASRRASSSSLAFLSASAFSLAIRSASRRSASRRAASRRSASAFSSAITRLYSLLGIAFSNSSYISAGNFNATYLPLTFLYVNTTPPNFDISIDTPSNSSCDIASYFSVTFSILPK